MRFAMRSPSLATVRFVVFASIVEAAGQREALEGG